MKRSIISTILFAGLLVALPLTGCTEDPQEPTEDELAGETVEDGEALGKVDGADSTFTFYTVRQDYRRCVFPLCGGYWVSRVNRGYTRCADGTWDRTCYVSQIDWPGLSMPADQTSEVRAEVGSGKLLLRGSMSTRDLEGWDGDIAALRVTEAWMGGSDNEPAGLVTKVTDSGIRCITTPCYNTLHEAKINSWRWTNLSELYLEDTGVSAEEIQGAMDQVFTEDGLIVAGYRYYWWDGGLQKGRYITQFWERIQPRAETECVVGGCSSQVCSDAADGPVITTCEWRPEYACFRAASCETQSDGTCGWTMDENLTECLDNPPGT